MSTDLKNWATFSDGWNRAAEDYDNHANEFTSMFGRSSVDEALERLNSSSLNVERLKILDVAAGVGAVSLYVAKKIGDKGEVLATDFSEEMVNRLNKRNEELKLTNISTKVMDGTNLDLPENSIDLYFSSFGIILLPTFQKGLEEAFRVLKPNGIFTITAWTSDMIYSNTIKETMSRLFPEDKSTPVAFTFEKDEDINNTLSQIGFKNVQIRKVTHEYIMTSYGFLMMKNPSIEAIEKKIGPENYMKFREIYSNVCKEKFSLPAKTYSSALVITATK